MSLLLPCPGGILFCSSGSLYPQPAFGSNCGEIRPASHPSIHVDDSCNSTDNRELMLVKHLLYSRTVHITSLQVPCEGCRDVREEAGHLGQSGRAPREGQGQDEELALCTAQHCLPRKGRPFLPRHSASNPTEAGGAC